MKPIMTLIAAVMLAGCAWSNWPGGGYGYPGSYGYGYPGYGSYGYGGTGYPGYGYYRYGPGYSYGYNRAREEDWRRWQAYQYGLSQGKHQGRERYQDRTQGGGGWNANRPPRGPQLPYGITRNRGGTYHVPGYGDFSAGQIQNYMRKKRR